RDNANGVGGMLDNRGTIVSAPGTGAVTLYSALNNSGSVQVQSGTLNIPANGIATGSFAVAARAALNFGNDGYTAFECMPGASLSGAGTVGFGTGLAAQFASGTTYNVTGKTIINCAENSNAGVLFQPGSRVQSLGALEIDSGLANFSTGSTITVPSFIE